MEVKVDLHLDRVSQKVMDSIDEGFLDMGHKIDQFATDLVPQKTSGLMTSTAGYPKKIGLHKFIFAFNKEYAAFQERGMRADGSHIVRNYSKAGTGAHFLERASDKVFAKAEQIMAYYVKKTEGIK